MTPPAQSRRQVGAARLLLLVALLAAVFTMHTAGDHDLNAGAGPSVPSVVHVMADAPGQTHGASDGHPSRHGVDDCLALLAAAVGVAALARAWTTRSPALVSVPGSRVPRWITVRYPGQSPPGGDLALLGVCRT